ncbi:MAG: cyclic nucleotide-binding domain-containing protein [bacterium]
MNIIECLKKAKLFAGVGDNNLQQIAEGCEIVSYENGEVVFNEGATDDHSLYVVMEGSVSITTELEKTDDKTKDEAYLLAVVESGDTFGEIAILDKGPRTAGARAEGKTTLIKLPEPFFSSLAEKRTEIGYRVIKNIAMIVSHRLREMDFAVKHRVFCG